MNSPDHSVATVWHQGENNYSHCYYQYMIITCPNPNINNFPPTQTQHETLNAYRPPQLVHPFFPSRDIHRKACPGQRIRLHIDSSGAKPKCRLYQGKQLDKLTIHSIHKTLTHQIAIQGFPFRIWPSTTQTKHYRLQYPGNQSMHHLHQVSKGVSSLGCNPPPLGIFSWC